MDEQFNEKSRLHVKYRLGWKRRTTPTASQERIGLKVSSGHGVSSRGGSDDKFGPRFKRYKSAWNLLLFDTSSLQLSYLQMALYPFHFGAEKRGKELASRKCTAAYDPGATSRNKCDRLNLWSSRCVIKVTRFQSLLNTETLLRLVEKLYSNSKGCVIYLALKLFLISWFLDLWT